MRPDARRWAARLSVGLPVAIAAVVAVGGLTRFPLWDAEAWTRDVALRPVGEMLAEVAADRHPPLFFLLEWVLVRLQDSDALLRAPAALAAVGLVAAGALVARRLAGDGAALVAGLLLATSPFVAAYAASARASIVIGGVGALVLATSLQVARGPRPERAAALQAAVLGVGLYLQYGVLCAWGAAGLAAVLGPWLSPDADRRWRRIGLGVGSVALSGLILAPWALGPGASQVASTEVVVRTPAVFRYLWWPVGPAWVPDGATLLLVLAAIGAAIGAARGPDRGVILGWVLAAVVVPWGLAGVQGFTAKAYVFAPFVGPFAVLVGLAAAEGGRWAVPIVAAVVLAVQVPGLVHTGSLPANLASISPRSVATFDTRRDVELLREVSRLTGHTVKPGPRGVRDWLRYAPDLDPAVTLRRPPAWVATDRSLREVDAPSLHAGDACRLGFALEVILTVPPADCRVFLDAMAARADGYGPFELELAQGAWEAKDIATAEVFARRAAEHTPASGLPESVLAGWMTEEGRLDEALDLLAAGADKAADHGRIAEWLHIEEQRLRAATAGGRRSEVRQAERMIRCLGHTFDAWEARACRSK